jgi:Protein of unknown function (DUF2000)
VSSGIGFAPEEIDTSAPTRAARLKWVIVVNESLAPGLAANAAICAAAATSPHIEGLLGPGAVDADAAALRVIRAKAAAHEQTFVADMPAAAQWTRVYDEYLTTVSETAAEDIDYYAVSLLGPRNRVDRIIGRLPLLP